jgi:hypothetical protein
MIERVGHMPDPHRFQRRRRPPVQDAEALLEAWKVDIIAHCTGKRIYAQHTGEGSLARVIESGENMPGYLLPIDMGSDTGIRAWRIVRP